MIAWLVTGIVVAGLVVLFILFRPKRVGPIQTEAEMPVHWRYSDRNVMLVYVYLSSWLVRKSPGDAKERNAFIQSYFKERFKGVVFDTVEEMQRALNYPVHVRSVAAWVNKRMRKPNERKQLIDYLVALACDRERTTQMQLVALMRLADLIGIQLSYVEQQINWYRERYNPDSEADPTLDLLVNRPYKRRNALKCLQLKDPITIEDLKKAYRKLAKEYHPDAMHGASESEKLEAEQQFRELQEAYEYLLNDV
ncbi:MAG TPA: DnaJ domain-containing protein [Fluviicola sp.]|nr:DnaJ domain-containing protein [Fluviicola sp.]